MTDKNNTALSLCVDKVLDHIGASEQIRRNHVEKGLINEILMNSTFPILFRDNDRYHHFGSWCEGTTINGLTSDIDMLHCTTNIPVVEKISGRVLHCLLIVNDGSTKPGYVKLQLVHDGNPQFSNVATPNKHTCTDKMGRVCVSNNLTSMEGTEDVPLPDLKHERRGPAFTAVGNPDFDHVFAYRCSTIPSFSSGWINRHRNNGWPSKQQIDKMSTYGCFLVPKGHPSSQTEHMEWRISFSFQERDLMHCLNSPQHKCYILLKMIKQYVISKTNTRSISSYHLKTALFYTIENNPTHIWIPGNLVYCTELCLKQLLDWLNNENCPNFFVPEENVFDRLNSDVMKITAKSIRDMFYSDGQYFMSLTCDNFGELLKKSLSGNVLPNLSRDAIAFDLIHRKIYISRNSVDLANRLVAMANRGCLSDKLSALKLLLDQFRQSEERLASEKVFREINQGVNLILPYIHLQIAQTIAAIMLDVADADQKSEIMQEFNRYGELAKASNSLSVKLIDASLMFNENMLEECAAIVCDCEKSLNGNTIFVCPCSTVYFDYLSELIENGNTTYMSLLDFHNAYVTPCLMFLPSQADLVPTPLQYEMYRSVGADTKTINPALHYWFGTIRIDAKVYLLFLQYLVYSKLNKHNLAELTKWKLFNILLEYPIERPYMGHLETGFNLLGWIFMQENDLQSAAQCFLLSWQIRPDHNAAKWHMLVMMYEQYIQTSKT